MGLIFSGKGPNFQVLEKHPIPYWELEILNACRGKERTRQPNRPDSNTAQRHGGMPEKAHLTRPPADEEPGLQAAGHQWKVSSINRLALRYTKGHR
jgi:hypothetical protein